MPAAAKPERGRLLWMVSSSVLEGFEPDDLRFATGHNVEHCLFEHYVIPTGALLGGQFRLAPSLVLQRFVWEHYAEISSDRAGLVCACGLESAARAPSRRRRRAMSTRRPSRSWSGCWDRACHRRPNRLSLWRICRAG